MSTQLTPAQEVSPARAYQEYFGPAIFEPLADVTIAHAAPRPGERALDLACGTGIVTRRLAGQVGPEGRVLGLDVNPAMLAEARSHPVPGGGTVEWRLGDATTTDLPEAELDLVVCQQGLQFFPDRLAGARQMHRALRPGGRAVVTVWQALDRHPLFRALAEAEVPQLARLGAGVSRVDVEAPFSLGDADELREVFGRAGFARATVTAASIEARFATPEQFVRRMEHAYAAVVPSFAADPVAFDEYLEAISRATEDVVARYRQGPYVVVPMHAHVLVAYA